MTIYMETTRIDPEITVGEIQNLLMWYGAKEVFLEYELCQVSALSFQYVVSDQVVPFRLPCRWKEMETALRQSGKRPKSGDTFETWARRVAWRQILRWVEAQMALIETNMVKVQEIFFPYIITKSNETLFEVQEKKGLMLLGAGK